MNPVHLPSPSSPSNISNISNISNMHMVHTAHLSNANTAPSHFLRSILLHDIAAKTYETRRWAGMPALANPAHHQHLPVDPQPVRLRFPPEPNGYLHIGHAKSICLNFGLARDFGGVCHLRFDDTNPEKESVEFENSILDAVHWLGFIDIDIDKDIDKDKNNAGNLNKLNKLNNLGNLNSSEHGHGDGHGLEQSSLQPNSYLYYASDYFAAMYQCALYLIEQGLAYVDEQSAEEIRHNRGDFSKAGINSPFRHRTVAENLDRFSQMKAGLLPDGAAVLRAKIDMASPNINLRDPSIYRIRHVLHHRHATIGTWCIYPMYTFAHPIEDALENITHSICTLEFEDQRPFYDWLLGHLATGGLINTPPPRQYEFARLNLSYVVTSKRKLAQLVQEQHVASWDDPRLPTLAGLRRRGYTPAAIQLFCERIGVTKSDSWIDYSTLEGALRDTLDPIAARAMAVLQPIKLIITNFPEGMIESCTAPVHPHNEAAGQRQFGFSRELWIEADDFQAIPEKGYRRLYPPQAAGQAGGQVRLKYGFVVECTGFDHDGAGNITIVYARYFPDSKSGSPTSGNYKVKGVIGWVCVHDALPATVRLYDRLFTKAQPDAGGADFLTALNPHSLTTVAAYVEPSLAQVKPESLFQFERLGYFVADRVEHTQDNLVFNRAVSLKDTWKV